MHLPHELQNPQQGQQAVVPLPQNVPSSSASYQQNMLYYPQQQSHNQQSLSQADLNQYLDATRYVNNNTTSTSANSNSNDNNNISNGKNKNTNPNTIHKNNMISINNSIKGAANSFINRTLMNNPLLRDSNPALLSHINLNQLSTNPNNVNSNDQLPMVSISQLNSKTSHISKNTNSNSGSNGPKNDNITNVKNDNTKNTASDISSSNLSHLHSGSHDTTNNCNNNNTSNSSNISNISSNNTNADSSNLSTTTMTNSESIKPPHMNNPGFKKDYYMSEVSQHAKSMYYNSMNNNPHVINDPSIQESLSPYFQPFGVDVSHLPMTNPPIFQTSLPLYDEPVRRRRISISNGQISQLGEDIETVENLYNTQPPPMPSKGSISSSHPVMGDNIRKQQIPLQATRTIHKDLSKSSSSNGIPRNELLQPSTQPQAPVQMQSGLQQQVWPQNASAGNFVRPNTIQSQYALLVAQEQSISSHNRLDDSNHMTNPASMVHPQLPLAFNQQNLPLQTQPHIDQQHATLPQPSTSNMVNNNINSNVKVMTSSPYVKQETISPNTIPNNLIGKSTIPNDVNSPGTEAWKRARLLERNRIAASKCRQRKKIAQLQLQKDFDNLSRENIVIKKKLKYYEKLITKFRKFTESHFQNCHKSDGLTDLKMIEDMLMIDQDIYELDDNSSVVGLTDTSYMK